MKKISIVLNVILLIAVAVLYVLHFSNNTSNEGTSSNQVVVSDTDGSPEPIVYVNIDSLLNSLDFYIDETASLQARFTTEKTKFENRAMTFQKSLADLQQKAQKGLITSSNYRKKEEELQREGQYLGQLEQELTMKFNEEQNVMSRNIMFEITEFIKEYNKDKNYKFVINNAFGGTLLYGNVKLNITKDIINGMNAEYAKENK